MGNRFKEGLVLAELPLGKDFMNVSRVILHDDEQVLKKRPYLKKEWCIRIIENPIKAEPQEHNRYRFWGKVPELENRILRVVT